MLAKVYSENRYMVVEVPDKYAIESNKEEIMKRVAEEYNFANPIGCDFIPAGHHLCGYCGELTVGANEDILCSDCKSVFGHTRYSEL